MGRERGQSTVEWVGLLAVLALDMVALGAGIPGGDLARSIASRILCAASLADGCGDEPTLIAAYGTEVGELVRRHMPTISFEDGSHALPVDFRRCRETSCGDGPDEGLVHRSYRHLPVSAFVHVVDCRPQGAEEAEEAGDDCEGDRAGHLYIQYWTYYADSATLRGVPIVGAEGYHHDDWESVQIRVDPDGSVDERASSHNGYNYSRGVANWASDAGLGPLRELTETIGIRAADGWGPETHLLLVSGGSHAGNAAGVSSGARPRSRFTVTPPWRKQVWRDPEAGGTG